ncbi:MAG: hypothetical protein OFPII_18300 [Osedax symbiont Rs1]|nr:MAG: hypothetical protein OFPII_18300 [Osedax symbiont Rs1]
MLEIASSFGLLYRTFRHNIEHHLQHKSNTIFYILFPIINAGFYLPVD